MGVCAMDMLVLMYNMVYGCVCHGYAGIDMSHGVWVCVPWIAGIDMPHGVWVCMPCLCWY